MMHRLFSWTLLCVFIFSIGISLAMLSCRQLKSPLSVFFTNANGTECNDPCLLGLHPGKTVWRDAFDELETDLLVKQWLPRIASDRGGFADSFYAQGLQLVYGNSDGVPSPTAKVNIVGILFDDRIRMDYSPPYPNWLPHPIRAGMIQAWLGQPESITEISDNYSRFARQTLWVYNTRHVEVRYPFRDRNRVNPDDIVVAIFVNP